MPYSIVLKSPFDSLLHQVNCITTKRFLSGHLFKKLTHISFFSPFVKDFNSSNSQNNNKKDASPACSYLKAIQANHTLPMRDVVVCEDFFSLLVERKSQCVISHPKAETVQAKTIPYHLPV